MGDGGARTVRRRGKRASHDGSNTGSALTWLCHSPEPIHRVGTRFAGKAFHACVGLNVFSNLCRCIAEPSGKRQEMWRSRWRTVLDSARASGDARCLREDPRPGSGVELFYAWRPGRNGVNGKRLFILRFAIWARKLLLFAHPAARVEGSGGRCAVCAPSRLAGGER